MKHIAISGLWLRREGDYAVVLVEAHGQWIEVAREHVEGCFSHIIEPAGIKRRIDEACDEQSYADLAASGGIVDAP